MFSQLYNVVFPAFGRFFGLFSHLATMSFIDFANFFLIFPRSDATATLEYVNVFNGNLHNLVSPMALYYTVLGSGEFFFVIPATWIFTMLHNFTTAFVNSLFGLYLQITGVGMTAPVWVVMLVFSPVFVLLLGFLKHVLDAVPFF